MLSLQTTSARRRYPKSPNLPDLSFFLDLFRLGDSLSIPSVMAVLAPARARFYNSTEGAFGNLFTMLQDAHGLLPLFSRKRIVCPRLEGDIRSRCTYE